MQYRTDVCILVAEDDPDDRQMIAAEFAKFKISNRVTFVKNGEEALDYLTRAARPGGPDIPSLILLDINMPRKDGIETLQAIRADERLHHIPIVMLTVSEDREQIDQCYELGASAFITKPTTFSGFAKAIAGLHGFYLEVVTLPASD